MQKEDELKNKDLLLIHYELKITGQQIGGCRSDLPVGDSPLLGNLADRLWQL